MSSLPLPRISLSQRSQGQKSPGSIQCKSKAPSFSKPRNISADSTSCHRFSGKEMEHIEIAHRPTNTLSDSVALNAVRFLRFCMDKATRYRHPLESDGNDPVLAEKGKMTESKWLVRFIFLESVAGVPGMVGGMLRHLHSLRRLKRDNGWVRSRLHFMIGQRPCTN